MARRVKPRGRSFRLAAAEVVAQSAQAGRLHALLSAKGLTLTPRARAYLRRDGDVSVRLVWRDRAAGETVTLSLLCPAVVRDGDLIVGVNYVLRAEETWSWSATAGGGPGGPGLPPQRRQAGALDTDQTTYG